MPFTDDQHPVQALAAGAGDLAFRDRVRASRPDRRLDHPDPCCREHSVERVGELGVPGPDEELEALSMLAEVQSAGYGPAGSPTPPSEEP